MPSAWKAEEVTMHPTPGKQQMSYQPIPPLPKLPLQNLNS